MKIHGRELEQHDCGNIIYYDNILIRSKSQKLNEWSTFESWAEYIEANPNFCGCKYHTEMGLSCSVCIAHLSKE